MVKDMWHLGNISAFAAWERRAGREGVVVAVIDTGVFLNHEDLRGNIWTNDREIPDNGVDDDGNGYVDDVHGWNFVRGNNNPTAELVFQPASGCAPNPSKKQTYELHGTHVSGTIGALGDNGRGIVGIARDVRIMPLKVMGGPCGSEMTSNIIQAVQYAVENGANVINMSLGGGGRSEILLEQLKAAGERGILVVAAAGNEAKDNDMRPSYPASFDLATLISVAASGADDGLARFSNFGATSVDLAAPGVRILSSVPEGSTPQGPKSGYVPLSGTSMAAPVVAGAVALMIAQYPGLPMSDIRRRLLDSVDPVEALSGKVASGGRLNLGRALGAAVTPRWPKAPREPRRPVRSIDGIRIGPAPTGRVAPVPSGATMPSGELSGKDFQ